MNALSFLFICNTVTAILGTLLYLPQGPDIHQSPQMLLGTFFIFMSYICSLYFWGRWIQQKLNRPESFSESIFFGSAFFALLICAIGFLPSFVGQASKPYWNMILLSGSLLCLSKEKRFPKLTIPTLYVPHLLFALFFSLKFLTATIPQGFWDSLWYHLTAARFWFESAHIYLPPTFPTAYLTGLWDYHFLFAQILLGSQGDGGGLIAAQIFSQWLSLFFFLCVYLLLNSRAKQLALSYWSILWACLGTELFAISSYAMNDWGTIFWSLSALLFYLEEAPTALFALACGISFTAKYTSAYFLLPLILLKLYKSRINFRELFLFMTWVSLACAPILLRNLLSTGNPFFPALCKFFPSELLGPSWRNIAIYEGFSFNALALKEKFFFLCKDNFPVFGIILFPLVRNKFAPQAKTALYCALFSFCLFLFFSGPKIEWRLSGACILILACYGVSSLEYSLLQITPTWTQRIMALLSIAFLLQFTIKWLPTFKIPDPTAQIREWPSGASMAWIRMNAKEHELSATLNEQRIYYLFPRQPLRAFDSPVLDRALATANSSMEAVQIFRMQGIRYLVLSAEFLDLYYNRRICEWMQILSDQRPDAVPFRTNLSRVLDLNRL